MDTAANSVHLNPQHNVLGQPRAFERGESGGGRQRGQPQRGAHKPAHQGVQRGDTVEAGRFQLLADKSKAGYASASSRALRNNYKGIVFDKGGLRLQGQWAKRGRAVHEGQLRPRQPAGGATTT